MQSIHVDYNDAAGTIARIENASPQPWHAVCDRYDNDVRRIRAVADQAGYNALYVCYDENNQPVYYLVEEDQALLKLRHRNQLRKLGRPTD